MGSNPRLTLPHGPLGCTQDLPELVRAVKDALTGDGSVESLIDSATFEVSSREFTRLITACRSPRQWRKAIEILDIVKRRNAAGLVHMNFFAYSAAISVCCRSGRVKEGLKLLREMENAASQDSSLAPDSVVYKLLVACCMKARKYRQAVDLCWECFNAGLEPDDQSLQHALKALIYLKKWKMAGDVLDKLHARQRYLPVEDYNVFIAGCHADGNLTVITEVLLTMQMVGVSPDAHTCELVLLSIIEAGFPEMGLEFLGGVLSCGIHVAPEAFEACWKSCSFQST